MRRQRRAAAGLPVERVRYRPGEVPMVAEFASAQAIDAEERESVVATFEGRGGDAASSSSPIPTASRSRRPNAGVTIPRRRGRAWPPAWLGVADDLAGVAILVQGLEAVLETGKAPLGDVILASTPGKRHARGVSALLHGGLRADAAVYLHPAGVGRRHARDQGFRLRPGRVPRSPSMAARPIRTRSATPPSRIVPSIRSTRSG